MKQYLHFTCFLGPELRFSYIYFIALNSYFISAFLPFLVAGVQILTETSSVKIRNLHKVKSMFLHYFKKCIKPHDILFYKKAEQGYSGSLWFSVWKSTKLKSEEIVKSCKQEISGQLSWKRTLLIKGWKFRDTTFRLLTKKGKKTPN